MIFRISFINSGAKYPLVIGDMPFGSYVLDFDDLFMVRKNQLVNASITVSVLLKKVV